MNTLPSCIPNTRISRPFELIVPCGIEHCQMSSVSRETRREQDLDEFMGVVEREFASAYGRQAIAVDRAALEERLPLGTVRT